MTWIQTFNGQKFDFTRPRPEDIDIGTIAICLSRIQRFGAHLYHNYTVAEHSILMSKVCDPRYALECLMHDASEAYIGDIVRPLKMLLPEIKVIEQRIADAIWGKFNLDGTAEAWIEIKHWDNRLMAAEAVQLFAQAPVDNWHEKYVQFDHRIIPLNSQPQACELFLQRFEDLQAAR